MHNENTITGYMALGFKYDKEEQALIVEEIGIEEYLYEFNRWFKANTSGSCTWK